MKVKTIRGREIDMSALIAKNQHVPAVGNARMNARGDIIDRSGKVVKKREEMSMEYHQNVSKSVKSVGVKSLTGEIFGSPAEAVAAQKAKMQSKAQEAAARLNQMAGTHSQPNAAQNHAQNHTQAPEGGRKRKLIEDPDANL